MCYSIDAQVYDLCVFVTNMPKRVFIMMIRTLKTTQEKKEEKTILVTSVCHMLSQMIDCEAVETKVQAVYSKKVNLRKN